MNCEEYAAMYQAEVFHGWYRGLRGMIRAAICRHVPAGRASLRIGDIGCGTGANLDAVRTLGRVVGLDLSREALKYSRQRGINSLAQSDAAQTPFAPDLFDVVLSCDVIYHRAVADPARAVRELSRILKRGGYLFINVPAYEWMWSTHDDAVHTGRRFTRPELARLLEDAGFEVVQLTHWNTLLFPLIAVTRFLRRHGTARASDIHDARPGLTHGALAAIFAVERRLMRLFPLPFGLSIFAVAKKR